VAGKYGYAAIDVDGPAFKVAWYDKGIPAPGGAKLLLTPMRASAINLAM